MRRFVVYFYRDGNWWTIEIPELDTVGQTDRRETVSPVARELIGLWFDAPTWSVPPPRVICSRGPHMNLDLS